MTFDDNTDDKKSKRYVTLSDEVAELLAKEADRKGIKPEELFNNIIRSEMQFYSQLSKIGYVEILGPDFPLFLKMLQDSDIQKVARKCAATSFDSMLSLMHGRPNDPDSIIEKFYKMFERHSGWFTFKYGVTGNGLRFVLEHTYGRKWSVFLSEYNTVIWEKMCNNIKPRIRDNAVSFDISLNHDTIKAYMGSGRNVR